MANVNSIDSSKVQVRDMGAELAAEYAAKPVLKAVIDFESAMLDMQILLDAFDEIGGDSAPAWLTVVRNEFTRLDAVLSPVSIAARASVDDLQ